MIELRYVIPEHTITEQPRLQFRQHNFKRNSATKWTDVPLVVLGKGMERGDHKITREISGKGIESSTVSVCCCGWRGRTEYAHNDHMYSNLREQEDEHLTLYSI